MDILGYIYLFWDVDARLQEVLQSRSLLLTQCLSLKTGRIGTAYTFFLLLSVNPRSLTKGLGGRGAEV